MIGSQRKEAILSFVNTSKGASVAELTHLLGASTATVRRDLDELAEAGKLTRVRGGAQRIESDPDPLESVACVRPTQKQAIGAAAAELVTDGSTILIDIGTTTAHMVEHLLELNLTIVTTSLDIVRRLIPGENIEIIVAGGVLRRSYHSLVGALTQDALSRVRVDTCFLSASGIAPDGSVLDNTGMEQPVKQAMLGAADRVVVLADGAKLPGSGLLTVCGPERVDVLITSSEADESILERFRAAGSQVIVVPATAHTQHERVTR